jgi:hypothetical protein
MKKLAFVTLILILSGCGSTSQMRNTQKLDNNQSSNKSKNVISRPDLSKYTYVIVNDFGDGVSKSHDNPNIISQGTKFADLIASSIKSKNLFDKIERNANSTESALLIDGNITQYEEGNPALRTLIGLGAGSSHFDAKVNFKDNITKELLAEIDVDQMSWALGGIMAGSQDVKSHMNSSAKKIADEVALSKKKELTSETDKKLSK